MSRVVYAIATMDTKGAELAFLAKQLRDAGVLVRTVDVGTAAAPQVGPDVSREAILGGTELPSDGERGTAITVMGQALTAYLQREVDEMRVAGVVGIGGSGGTALITAAMRQLPIGLPKLMVSTVASGDTSAYVDCSDITMMFSVVDVAGLNAVSTRILANAAHAMAGMVSYLLPEANVKPAVGLTMFGVTTPCVTTVRQQLEREGYDALVFHATGTGGRAMERLVQSGMIGGVLDITTTEFADEIVGGIFPCGPERFDRVLDRQVPLVISLGALDMVNFAGIETVPTEFRHRKLLVHNAQITLMRTSADENRQVAERMASKLNRAPGAWTLVIPEGGLSSLDAPGQPFYDPEADAALFDELQARLETNASHRLVRSEHHINEQAFALRLLTEFRELTKVARTRRAEQDG